jgi:hypothetical protein
MAEGCADLPTQPVAPGDGAPAYEDAAQTSSCCILDPVIVVAPGPVECDPYQSLDWCEGDGGECMTSWTGSGDESGYLSTEGCNDTGGGSPGDGSSPPPPGAPSPAEPPPTVQPDTCKTGDPTVDDPAVQQAFIHIWSNSNYGPDVPMNQRIEDGGWIIRNADGTLRFMSFPVSYGRGHCSIDIPAGVSPPAGTVAWVHSHPFAAGEKLTECDWQSIPGVGNFPLTYQNQSSAADDQAQAQWRAQGYNISAYMIDANTIVRFDGTGTAQGETKYSRCGY